MRRVEALTSDGPDASLTERLRTGGSDRRSDAPDAIGSERRVKARGELGIAVPDQELGRGAAPTPVELLVLREQRVPETVSDGPTAAVKGLLQALIHGIRVDGRAAIHPIYRVPVGEGHHEDSAVRAASRSVEVNGLEPSASALRIQAGLSSGLGVL
jgi:hypothetical protein